jgi:hypothetical protein
MCPLAGDYKQVVYSIMRHLLCCDQPNTFLTVVIIPVLPEIICRIFRYQYIISGAAKQSLRYFNEPMSAQ